MMNYELRIMNYFVGEAVGNMRCAAVARHSRESGNPLPAGCRPCGRIMNYEL
ncbi:MAG: hypothetical protein LBE35_06270 [Clostridiales bacterium]|nr:hypothetical protein [Clostridiales bacterium]